MADIAKALGTPLMPWQQHVADVALEVNPVTGRLAYRDVVLTVPRQSGKTTLLLGLILFRALVMGRSQRQHIVYTAQSGSAAREKWFDGWLPELDKSPFARTYHPRKATGSEALLFKNGSIQSLIASTEQSGHGSTLDLAIVDEAFAQRDNRVEGALSPAMITRPEAQFWVVSTAGTPDRSPFLLGKVESGRMHAEAGITDSLAYFEWSAADDVDPADPATWWSCMPALGRTQPESAVRAEFLKHEAEGNLNEFERAYLNRWKSITTDPVIPLDKWNACVDTEPRIDAPVCLAFDVAKDRTSASIALSSSRSDGRAWVEAVDNKPGTDWLAPAVAQLVAKLKPAVVLTDPGGPAGSMVPDMERHGVELTLIDAREHSQACGFLFDQVIGDRLRHMPDPMLAMALEGAKKRTLGDAWAWSRRSSSVDISPLVAVTFALWAHSQHRPVPPKARAISLAAVLAAKNAR